MPEVKICDVTLRDGMQAVNRRAVVPLSLRLELARRLQTSGLPYLEVGSFVNPNVIPAMRDTPELFAALEPVAGQELAALVPNLKYYRRLREVAVVDTVALLVSASEGYAMLNTRMTREQATLAAAEVARAARRDGLRVRAYMSYAFRGMGGGAARPGEVVEKLCERLLEAGCELVALSDTDGKATPGDVGRLTSHLVRAVGPQAVGVHLHDRYGSGLVNALVAFQAGVRTFDGSIGGVGGNKMLANSVGNVATEELVYMFHGLGVETGVDFETLIDAGRILCEMVRLAGDPPPPSKVLADRITSREVRAAASGYTGAEKSAEQPPS